MVKHFSRAWIFHKKYFKWIFIKAVNSISGKNFLINEHQRNYVQLNFNSLLKSDFYRCYSDKIFQSGYNYFFMVQKYNIKIKHQLGYQLGHLKKRYSLIVVPPELQKLYPEPIFHQNIALLLSILKWRDLEKGILNKPASFKSVQRLPNTQQSTF